MNFQLSSDLDSNKVFLIKRSELEGRFDPIMALYQKRTTHFKYTTEHLSNLLRYNPQYGANEAGIERVSIKQPRYIRITDIDEYGLLKREIGKTAEKIESKHLLHNNDLLFARSGATVGKAYIHKTRKISYPCFFAGYMIRFVVNEEKLEPDYLFAYTQLGVYKDWVAAIQRAAGQPNINAEEYKSLKIPIPSKEIQSQIVAKMDAAYVSKKHKEAEAQRLLDSIDDYLLDELGIELPEQEENTVQNRMFTRQLREVSGGRFDAFYYQAEFKKLVFSLNNSPYETKKLNNLPIFIESGSRPSGGVSNIEKGILSFGGEHVNNQCEIEVKKPKYIPQEYHVRNLATKTKLHDILLVKDGATTGKIGLITDNKYTNQNINEHVFLIRFESIINSQYFVSLLNTKFYQRLIKRIITGATVTGLTKEVVEKIKIPVPPIKKQTEIADHITNIRNRAKQLQQQAKEELEQAKKEVEAMILGADEKKA